MIERIVTTIICFFAFLVIAYLGYTRGRYDERQDNAELYKSYYLDARLTCAKARR